MRSALPLAFCLAAASVVMPVSSHAHELERQLEIVDQSTELLCRKTSATLRVGIADKNEKRIDKPDGPRLYEIKLEVTKGFGPFQQARELYQGHAALFHITDSGNESMETSSLPREYPHPSVITQRYVRSKDGQWNTMNRYNRTAFYESGSLTFENQALLMMGEGNLAGAELCMTHGAERLSYFQTGFVPLDNFKAGLHKLIPHANLIYKAGKIPIPAPLVR